MPAGYSLPSLLSSYFRETPKKGTLAQSRSVGTSPRGGTLRRVPSPPAASHCTSMESSCHEDKHKAPPLVPTVRGRRSVSFPCSVGKIHQIWDAGCVQGNRTRATQASPPRSTQPPPLRVIEERVLLLQQVHPPAPVPLTCASRTARCLSPGIWRPGGLRRCRVGRRAGSAGCLSPGGCRVRPAHHR